MNDTAAPQDARVRAAISHWAPRFVANGIALTDFEEVTASIARWEDWCRAWSNRAAVHEKLDPGHEAARASDGFGRGFVEIAFDRHRKAMIVVADGVPRQPVDDHAPAIERPRALPRGSRNDEPGRRHVARLCATDG